MEEYLSVVEKEKIAAFVGDEVMFEAVKKVLLFDLYQNGTLKPDKKAVPVRNAALSLYFANQEGEISDEALGRDLRALASGIHTVEGAFGKLKGLGSGKTETPSKPRNPGR